MRVAIGGIHTECSTYSPLMQVADDFNRTEGQALLEMAGVGTGWEGIEAIPIFHDRSIPGGPVSPDLFRAQCDGFCDRLRAALPLDGVLLIMHGAYFVPGVDDPEGEFVTRIREVVGPGAVISSAWDLHGQITERIAATVDAFAAFRTAPHVDQPQTRARAARMLLEALRGGPRPQVVRRAIPLLVSGEMSSTFVEPCRSLYAMLPGFDARAGILDANLMIGYVWADSPRATAAAIVTCTDRVVGETVAAEIAASYWSLRDALVPDMEAGALGDLLDAAKGRTILADSGDNPTAGGVGDRADVLAALVARGWAASRDRRAIIAGIAAPHAIAALRRKEAEIRIGGELGGGGPVQALRPDRVRLVGADAVVEAGGIELVLTERRRPFHHLSDFRTLGLDPSVADLLVVKSGYLSPELRELPMAQVMALTGARYRRTLRGWKTGIGRARPGPFRRAEDKSTEDPCRTL